MCLLVLHIHQLDASFEPPLQSQEQSELAHDNMVKLTNSKINSKKGNLQKQKKRKYRIGGTDGELTELRSIHDGAVISEQETGS